MEKKRSKVKLRIPGVYNIGCLPMIPRIGFGQFGGETNPVKQRVRVTIEEIKGRKAVTVDCGIRQGGMCVFAGWKTLRCVPKDLK